MSRLMMTAVLGALMVFGAACAAHDDELQAKDKQLQEKQTELESANARVAAEQQNTALTQRKLEDANAKLTELQNNANRVPADPNPKGPKAATTKDAGEKPVHTAKVNDANVHTEHMSDGSTMYRLTNTFGPGSSVLTKEGVAAVSKIAAEIKKSSGKVSIDGHTDLTPLTGANKTRYINNENLSKARATAVMNALAKDGIAKTRMHAVGHGDTQPLEQGTSKEANAKNRRIEITVH